jgi:hypothetical protein
VSLTFHISIKISPKAIKLTRSELVALINGFGRLSDSLRSIKRFRQILAEREANHGQATTPIQIEHDYVVPSSKPLVKKDAQPQSPPAQEPTTEPTNDSKPKIDLSFTMIDDPKRMITMSVGFVIFVLGLISVTYKGYQMQKGTMHVPEEYEKYTVRNAQKVEKEQNEKEESKNASATTDSPKQRKTKKIS